MSYTPHIEVRYRLAERGEIQNGRTADVKDLPGGQAEILFDPDHSGPLLPLAFTQLCTHQIVHGQWRQRWAGGDRVNGTAQGLRLAVSRWERVPGHQLPSGLVLYAVEEAGSCLWLIDEDECTMQLQNDMNDLLLRLAGDGLWIQIWFRHHGAALDAGAAVLLPSAAVPALA
ncbi:hypothetical protein OG407_07405 [Streptomyces sp. NBC_01515]|uniref:hypothetical protein n=1 Tax=Streptomyces sp. NBC_01515 TaxID=2903890 RepID=UPI0038702C33